LIRGSQGRRPQVKAAWQVGGEEGAKAKKKGEDLPSGSWKKVGPRRESESDKQKLLSELRFPLDILKANDPDSDLRGLSEERPLPIPSSPFLLPFPIPLSGPFPLASSSVLLSNAHSVPRKQGAHSRYSPLRVVVLCPSCPFSQ
jgi:hypothetical protein